MAQQKVIEEPKKGRKKARDKKITDKPKKTKQKRSKEQIDRVKARGTKLANTIGAIIVLSSIKWKVSSQTARDLWYVVTLTSQGLICQCPANAGGKKICKHAFGIHKLLEKEWWSKRKRKIIRIRRRGLMCKYAGCGSNNVVRNGTRDCTRKEPVQRYLCKACGRTFSGIEGFAGRHFDATVIIEALSMVSMKMSADEARKQLKLRGVYVHESTIYCWMRDYSGMLSKYTAKMRVDAGHQWHVDEIFVKIFGKESYLFGVMDGATRFILSHEMSRVKQGVDPTNLFRAAANRAWRLPWILVSDGLPDFCRPAKKVFYRMAGPRFVHIREIHIRNIFNQNNVYESLNGEFESRLQCTRGLKSMDSPIIKMLITYHNFFREHTSLENNMTPAEAIGIHIMQTPDSDLPPDTDRWVTLIQNAAIDAAA